MNLLNEKPFRYFGLGLINMIFNLGNTGFRGFKKTIAFIDGRDYEAAALEMLDSLWARQVGIRSEFLSELMFNG